MGKKKNEERVQMKTPGRREPADKGEEKEKEKHQTMEVPNVPRSVKCRETEAATKLTVKQSLGEKMKTPNVKELRRDYTFIEEDEDSDENIPDSWEEEESTTSNKWRKETEGQSQRTPVEVQKNKKDKELGGTFPNQHGLGKASEEKDEEANDQDNITAENSKTSQTLRKMAKIDRSFMKTLLSLAGGAEDKETLLDKLLTEFSKMKSLTLEATHEVARLQGTLSTTREQTVSKDTYADKVRNQSKNEGPRVEIPDFFEEQGRESDKREAKLALIITSDRLDKNEIKQMVKRKVDPQRLGVPEPEMRPGKEGIVITSTSKKGLQRLEEFIKQDDELGKKLKTRQPKGKQLEIKVIGIDEEMENEDILRRIVQQNELDCSLENVQVTRTWKGKNGKTAIVALDVQAWQGIKDKSHLNIGWERCPVYDNTFVPRCTFCAKYGHTQRWCQARSPKCTECGGAHHYKECRVEEYECRICMEEGTEADAANHSMMAMTCPTFLRRREQERNRIIRQLQLGEV